MEFKIEGILFLIIVWGIVIGLLAYCFYKVLTGKEINP